LNTKVNYILNTQFEDHKNLEKYFKWSEALVLVYSIIDIESFHTIIQYLDQIAELKRKYSINDKSTSTEIILIGNKTDMERYRQVSKKDIENIIDKYDNDENDQSSNFHITHIETTCCEEFCLVQSLFHKIIRTVRKAKDASLHSNSTDISQHDNNNDNNNNTNTNQTDNNDTSHLPTIIRSNSTINSDVSKKLLVNKKLSLRNNSSSSSSLLINKKNSKKNSPKSSLTNTQETFQQIQSFQKEKSNPKAIFSLTSDNNNNKNKKNEDNSQLNHLEDTNSNTTLTPTNSNLSATSSSDTTTTTNNNNNNNKLQVALITPSPILIPLKDASSNHNNSSSNSEIAIATVALNPIVKKNSISKFPFLTKILNKSNS
jgi:hypothetical protein